MQLRGEAKRTVLELGDESWNGIRSLLLEYFAYLSNKNILTSQLENLRQEKNETLTTYAERARELLQEKNATYDYLTPEQKEEHNRLAKKAFAKGIKDIKLKDRMLTRDATSLEDAIAYAIESENEKSFQISQNELFCRFCRLNGHREIECRRKNVNGDSLNTLITTLQSFSPNRPNFGNNRNFFNRQSSNWFPRDSFNRPNPNWFNRNSRFQDNNRFQDNSRFQDNNRFSNRGFGNNRFNNFNNANNNQENNENFQSNANRNNNGRFLNQNRNNPNQFQRSNQPTPRQENQMNAVEPVEESEN